RVAERRHVGDVRVLRVNLQLPDLTDVAQAGELPALAGIDRFVDAAAEDDVGPNRLAAGADVDHIRVRVGHVDRADRPGRDLPIRDRHPGDAVVLRFPDAAAGRAHVEDVRLRSYAGGRGRASA